MQKRYYSISIDNFSPVGFQAVRMMRRLSGSVLIISITLANWSTPWPEYSAKGPRYSAPKWRHLIFWALQRFGPNQNKLKNQVLVNGQKVQVKFFYVFQTFIQSMTNQSGKKSLNKNKIQLALWGSAQYQKYKMINKPEIRKWDQGLPHHDRWILSSQESVANHWRPKFWLLSPKVRCLIVHFRGYF